MPNAPKKPATPKKGTPVKAKAAKTSAAETEADQTTAVETALKRCTAHLKHLDAKTALEVIARLKDYYLKYGVKVPKGGFKFD